MNDLKSIGNFNFGNIVPDKQVYGNYIKRSDFDELVNHLDIEGLTKEEQELFYKITQDSYISDAEIESLSYEQTKKIKQLIFDKEAEGFEASYINGSEKAVVLMSTSLFSNDETFNKSMFNLIKDTDKLEDIITITTILVDAYNLVLPLLYEGEDVNIDFTPIETSDMTEYINEKIDEMVQGVKNSKEPYAKEAYELVLSFYKKIQAYHDVQKGELSDTLLQFMQTNKTSLHAVLFTKKEI